MKDYLAISTPGSIEKGSTEVGGNVASLAEAGVAHLLYAPNGRVAPYLTVEEIYARP